MPIIPITNVQIFRITIKATVDAKVSFLKIIKLINVPIAPRIMYKAPAAVKKFHPGVLTSVPFTFEDIKFHDMPTTPRITYKTPVNIDHALLCALT